MMKRSLLSLFFFALLLDSAFAQKLVLLDDRKTWNIAIADFEMPETTSDTPYITKSLPAFFFNQLSACKNHRLQENEIARLREVILSERIAAEEKKLSSLKNDYDMSYFSGNTKKREIRDSINNIEKTLRQLKRYKTEKIPVKTSKDIFFLTEAGDGAGLQFERVNIDSFVSGKKIDYMIYGFVRQFDDVLFISVRLYSFYAKDVIYDTSLTADTSNLFASLEKTVTDLTSILLGQPWSRLSVNTGRRDADIYLDGSYIGSGTVKRYITPPGNHILGIRGQGIRQSELNIVLSESEDNIIDLFTEESEEKLIAVNTQPQEAEIYYDSLWRGSSPYIVNGKSGELIIKKEGFRDFKLFLDDVEGNYLDIKLSPEIFDRDDYLENRRDTFYKSLTFFMLSVPAPFFLFAVLNDYSDAYNNAVSSNTNSREIDRLRKLSSFSYYTYYGSLFLSISLFVNTLFHLDDYIKAGDVLGYE